MIHDGRHIYDCEGECVLCNDQPAGLEIARLRAIAPAWTTTPPTKPGWYWAATAAGKVTEIVEVASFANDHLLAFVVGFDVQRQLDHFRFWSGPIELPRIPIELPRIP